jgi:hypothetical protein
MAPTDARRRQTYLPSLLDRRQDDAPRRRSEHPDAFAPNAERMRRLVERDLALLLNATNLESDLDVERFPAAAASVVNYGMPPLSGGYAGTHHADAIAAGEKSSMLSNVMSTNSRPSPDNVFGTANATRGFIAFIRLSKLSMSILKNRRSPTAGSGSTGLPDKSASTPITNGNSTFFSEP